MHSRLVESLDNNDKTTVREYLADQHADNNSLLNRVKPLLEHGMCLLRCLVVDCHTNSVDAVIHVFVYEESRAQHLELMIRMNYYIMHQFNSLIRSFLFAWLTITLRDNF